MRRGAHGHLGTFIITPDLPGFSVGKKEDKMGLRASPTVQLVFDNMRVPADRLLGEAGQGFVYAMQSLEHGRLGIAAQAVGIAEAALDTARRLRRRAPAVREAIKEFEAIQFKLADMATRVARRRARCCTAARRPRIAASTIDAVQLDGQAVRQRAAMWVTTQAIQIFGGYGYVNGLSSRTPVPRRQGHRDLRRHLGDPAHRDRARAVLASVTHLHRFLPAETFMKLFDTMPTLGHEQVVLLLRQVHRLPRHHRDPRHHRSAPRSAACRFWNYATDEEAVVDALRLSRGMTYKNAVAGLNLGGGKSVIIGDNQHDRIAR